MDQPITLLAGTAQTAADTGVPSLLMLVLTVLGFWIGYQVLSQVLGSGLRRVMRVLPPLLILATLAYFVVANISVKQLQDMPPAVGNAAVAYRALGDAVWNYIRDLVSGANPISIGR